MQEMDSKKKLMIQHGDTVYCLQEVLFGSTQPI